MIRCMLVLGMLALPLSSHADISTLRWLAGCWAQDGQEPGSVEHWTAPAGGSMLGLSRIVKDGKTVSFEYLRIVAEEDGWTGLIASPSGQETARFRMISMSANDVVFENPDHDFPQRIIYRLHGDGKLLGRIEGTVDGKERSADFPMTKTPCPNEDEPE